MVRCGSRGVECSRRPTSSASGFYKRSHWAGTSGSGLKMRDATPNGCSPRMIGLLWSGAMNMGYMVSFEDTRAASGIMMMGSHNAARMFRERLSARSYISADRLINMLATVTAFQATDARDKIYALLGLTCDGASFTQHVSYAPWDSAGKVFIRFARLFVERNEGIEVLLQAGLRDEEYDEWPSWVPHWDNPSELSGGTEATPGPGNSSPCMRVDESGQALHISGVTILDQIKVINDSVFEKLQVIPNGVSIAPFVWSLAAGFRMVFETAHSSTDPEKLLEALFHVVAQPKPIPQDSEATATLLENDGENSSGSGPSLSSVETPSQSATQHNNRPDQEEYDGEYQALRTVGLGPKRTKVGDSVAAFEGSNIHFILRRVVTHRLEEEDAGEEEKGKRYRLVGPAYFYVPESGGKPSAAVGQDIIIV